MSNAVLTRGAENIVWCEICSYGISPFSTMCTYIHIIYDHISEANISHTQDRVMVHFKNNCSLLIFWFLSMYTIIYCMLMLMDCSFSPPLWFKMKLIALKTSHWETMHIKTRLLTRTNPLCTESFLVKYLEWSGPQCWNWHSLRSPICVL